MSQELPDSLWLYRSRIGYSDLVKVREFGQRYRTLRAKIEHDSFDYAGFDINVDEVKVQTPVQIIDEVICNKVNMELNPATVGNDQLPAINHENGSSSQQTPGSFLHDSHRGGDTSSRFNSPAYFQPDNGHASQMLLSQEPGLLGDNVRIQQSSNIEFKFPESHRAVHDKPPDVRATLKRKGLEDVPKFAELIAPLQTLKRKQKLAVSRAGAHLNKLTEESLGFEIDARTKGEHESVAPNEVILRVAIFHPKNGTKSQEFLVLGNQSLAELADRIYCVQSSTQDAILTPGSCFFIEDGAYDDTRRHKICLGRPRVNPADIASLSIEPTEPLEEVSSVLEARVVRYSEPVINWCSSEAVEHENLASYSMEGSTFNDLTLRLGSHYSFCHQGDCSHVIVFTDMRIFNSNDHPNKLAYPLRCFESRIKRQRCRVCDLLPATAVTYGDKRSSEDPCFFCESCYRLLHYSDSDTLLYDDFSVYPYVHE